MLRAGQTPSKFRNFAGISNVQNAAVVHSAWGRTGRNIAPQEWDIFDELGIGFFEAWRGTAPLQGLVATWWRHGHSIRAENQWRCRHNILI
jgi:hypothetical protein